MWETFIESLLRLTVKQYEVLMNLCLRKRKGGVQNVKIEVIMAVQVPVALKVLGGLGEQNLANHEAVGRACVDTTKEYGAMI